MPPRPPPAPLDSVTPFPPPPRPDQAYPTYSSASEDSRGQAHASPSNSPSFNRGVFRFHTPSSHQHHDSYASSSTPGAAGTGSRTGYDEDEELEMERPNSSTPIIQDNYDNSHLDHLSASRSASAAPSSSPGPTQGLYHPQPQQGQGQFVDEVPTPRTESASTISRSRGFLGGEGEEGSGSGKSPGAKEDWTLEMGGVDEERRRGKQVSMGLRRGLKNRHVTLISIGGTIGTGLFIGSANSLQQGGPLGLLLGYSLIGTVVGCVMISLGEMISHLPVAGGHITLSRRFVDPSLSFAMGWAYWYVYAIILGAELSAAALLVSYWNRDISNAVWVTIFLTVITVINAFGARGYGELEFWFASIKIVTIVGLIILGIILDAGGGPHGDAIGFRYWRNPGPFVQYAGIKGAKGRFLGFWAVLIQASFAFVGTEIVAIASAEAQNPKRSIPRAIKTVFIRILLFYVLGVFIIGLLIPSNDPALNLKDGTAASSPFVIAIRRAEIKVLPDIINAALLSSAWSCASSNIFVSSRALYGMAIGGSAPKIFTKTTSYGLPWAAMIVSVLMGSLAYTSVTDSAGTTFGYFSTLTTTACLLTWCGICFTYLRWYNGTQVQRINRGIFPYTAPFQPFAAWYGLVGCTIVILFAGWNVFLDGQWKASTFITSYLPVPLFGLLWIGHKLVYRTKLVPPEKMDFQTGSADHEDDDDDGKTKLNVAEKVWRWMF